MNVSELFELTKWIKEEISDKKILQKYQTLQQILHQHSQPNEQRPSFESQKEDLIDTISKVPLYLLTKDQIDFLTELDISQAIGEEGVNLVEDLLYKNVIDVATSSKKLKEIHQKLTNGISKANQIKSGLDGCVSEEEYETDDEVLVRVSFMSDASLKNISDFKSWGNIWFEIGRGIAMAHNLSPEDVKIVGATKGSIIVELAVVASIATTASGIILSGLMVAEKVLDIRKKAEEIRNLKLQNKKLANDLEKEAENEKEKGIKDISQMIANKLKLTNNQNGEQINALDKAVKNLLDFIEKGGEVDFVIPEENGEESESEEGKIDYKELRTTFHKIRQLESKIKLIEEAST